MPCLRKMRLTEVSSLTDFKEIAYEQAKNFRDKYKLGNYCAKQLLDIIDLIEQAEMVNIKLIRTPFKNKELAGFIGYKYETFVIVTNTNLTLGNERFTIAHEIYHLLQNRVYIKQNCIIEEVVSNDAKNIVENMANYFAAELLIPGEDLLNYANKMTQNKTKEMDYYSVVQLQQKYGVDYIAITKRLKEIEFIDDKMQEKLEKILFAEGELEKITKTLGYDNKLNIPSKDAYLLQKDMEIIKENFDEGYTSYDDLVRIFGYLGCQPEKFGYENKIDLTDAAKDFMKGLLD